MALFIWIVGSGSWREEPLNGKVLFFMYGPFFSHQPGIEIDFYPEVYYFLDVGLFSSFHWTPFFTIRPL